MQEGVGPSALVGGLWDPTLNAPTFLEKTLLSVQAKEKLENLEEVQLVEQAVKQLGQALDANFLAISKLRDGKAQPRWSPIRLFALSASWWTQG